MEDQLHPIEETVDRIERGEGRSDDPEELRAWLTQVLQQVDQNPGIRASAADLYEAALTVADAGCVATQRQRRL